VGFLGAPLAMLGAVLLGRALASAWLFVADTGGWMRHVDWIADQGWLAALAMKPVRLLGGLWTAGWLGKVVLVVAVVGVVAAALDRRDRSPVAVVLVLALLAVVAVPLLADLGGLGTLLGLAALVWGIPATAIGLVAPLLERPSEHPRLWGFVAFGGAAVLSALTLARLGPAWLLAPAVLLAVAGVLFRREGGPEPFWPLLALCGGMLVAGSTWLRHEATTHGVFQRFHALNDVVLPQKAASRALALDAFPWLQRDAAFDRSRTLLRLGEVTAIGDDDVAAAAARLPLADGGGRRQHEEWLALRDGGKGPEERLARLRALADRVPPPARLALGTQPIEHVLASMDDPLRTFRERFATRLRADVAAVEALLALEREAGDPAALSSKDAGAVLERLDAGLATWRDPPSLERGRALRQRLGSAVAEAEGRRLQDLDVAATVWIARDEETRLEAPEDLLAALRTATTTWVSPERRAGAQAILERVESSHRAARDHERQAAARLLEACLTGSLGFWVCVGFLAGSAVMRRRDPHHA
jgi:hypothetical protein